MHTDDQLGDLPEALPLRRVAPLWRILALLEGVALVGLLFLLCILCIALLEQARRPPPTPVVMAAPPVAAAPAATAWVAPGMAVTPDDAEPVDPQNLPYPVQADLRDLATAEAPAGAKGTAREHFLGLGQDVWQNPRGYYPNHVIISPDGQALAYAAGENLVAGPIAAPKEIGDYVTDPNAPAGVVTMVGPRGRPMMMTPGGMMVNRQPNPLRRLVGVPAWCSDSRQVFFARACGQLWCCDVGLGQLTLLPFQGDSPAAVPNDISKLVFVRSRPTGKPDLRGLPAANDPTEVVLGDTSTNQVRVLVPASPSTWTYPAVSPDGKRLALVSDRGHEGDQPRRWRIFVVEMSGGEPVPLTPPANVVGPVCWTADGKALIYARSQEPPPPEYWNDEHQGMYRTVDLFQWDFGSNRETRLSRGGSCYSPSLTQDGNDLYYVAWVADRTGANVRLRQMPLAPARAFAEKEPTPPTRDADGWRRLVEQVLREAQAGLDMEAMQLTEDVRKKIVAAYERLYRERFQTEPPANVEGFDRQRRELQALNLPRAVRRDLTFLVGVIEGEYLCRRHAASWHLVKGKPLDFDGGTVAPERESPFGQVLNPFRLVLAVPLPVEDAPGKVEARPRPALADLLRQAEGRPFVLTNDPEAGLTVAASWADPGVSRATELLHQGKAEEAERVLLALVAQERHERNTNLALRAAGLLVEHKRKAAALKILERQRDLQPREARKYNLLGLALLLPPQKDGDPDPNAAEAVDAFKNALRCDLLFEVGYLNLAQAYRQAHDAASAKACLERYLHLFPTGRYVGDARRRLAELVNKDGK
jgi:Tol biopolymer transport system component/tetratricopeptide (TPR) repeat protein